MREVASTIIADFHSRPIPPVQRRHVQLLQMPGKASAIVGMRRTGKTFLCFQRIHDLLDQGIRKDQILYINFEDDRLSTDLSILDTFLSEYYVQYPDNRDSTVFLFLDEVQVVSGWESFVRRVLDNERVEVVVTGSSAKMLSSEIATSLRGRALTTEVFPYSFAEFLAVQEVNHTAPLTSAMKSTLESHFRKYLAVGGFPEVTDCEERLRRHILRGYVDTVVLRDVIDRHPIPNTSSLNQMVKHLMAGFSRQFSINKFYNGLKSQGLKVTKNDLYQYFDHLQDAYLFFGLPIFSRSERVRAVNPRKVYGIDPGLIRHSIYVEDAGHLLENIVFLHLRRQYVDLGYYLTKKRFEVDFLVPAADPRESQLIQVAWSVADDSTRAREVRALQDAMLELNLDRGIIVTSDGPDNEEIAPGITTIPCWRFLIQSRD